MKRFLCVVAVLLFSAMAAGAQDGPAIRREVKELALQQAEIEAIEKLVERDSLELQKAAGEIKILQARLERLLLEKAPSTEEIQKLVRASLEFEYTIRMARIERSIALRRLLGDRRWASLEKLVRAYAQAKRAGRLKDVEGSEAPAKLLGLLDRLDW